MMLMFVNKQRKFDLDQIEKFKEDCQKAMNMVNEQSFVDRSLRTKKTCLSATVTFVGAEYMRKTNAKFRGIHSLTDVLSFPLLDMHAGKLLAPLTAADVLWHKDGIGEISLGDVLISLEKAEEQAKQIGQSIDQEISFLAVHAALHLLGFDHIDLEDEKKMLKEQKKIIQKISVADNPSVPIVDEKAEELNRYLDHSGFVAIIGRPNVGKSTLLNTLSGMKIAIISHKPQTTRSNIRAIVNQEDAQIIFVDTPGIHKPQSELAKFMVNSSVRASKDSDVIVLMADGRFDHPSDVETQVVKQAERYEKKVILAINKCDSVPRESLLPIISNYSKICPFSAIIPISAKTGDGVDMLISEIVALLPPGPKYYPNEDITDQSEREIAAELIREQILHYTNQEIPHGTAVIIDKYEECNEDICEDQNNKEMIKIFASILCERDTHKAILLGKSGQMIKRIGSAARLQIEKMTGCQVYLEIHIKVRSDWKNKQAHLQELGYRNGE